MTATSANFTFLFFAILHESKHRSLKMKILLRYLLLPFQPEALKYLFALLLGTVAGPVFANLPLKVSIPLLLFTALGYWALLALLNGPYQTWFETVREKASQYHLIGATQPEVDLEAEPLNLPPMPDMFDIEYNPWDLP
jgi:hypothetical protein